MEEDAQLVILALADSQNYAKIVEKYEKPLLHYLLRISNITREEGEDLLQNIFLKAYQNLNDFDQSLKFSSWIYRIAHNEVISAWRKRSARAEEVNLETAEVAQILASPLDIPRQTDQKFLAKFVREILAKISQKYREVLVLRFLENKDYAEISDILQKPMGSVATLVHRAKHTFELAAREANFQKFI
ncbi:RNA polymerase sigma factor [Candidatus Gracilibacteria bacterium]|nr:RNA polymerase sigma factor [Candidatus Gracilibacteria bacterium]MCF7856078.1 RNA polymerase sigma factor [Candidatus Gracilibacteria bacterium]MCF7896497.1 RNA polymerase sigma factor [Candidatus Gracilibacteria bacterium]